MPIALVGLGVAAHATMRVTRGEERLTALAATSRAAGVSFAETLQDDHVQGHKLAQHVEQQMQAYDERRALALSLATARRDQLLGFLVVIAAVLLAAGLRIMGRIAREVEEDRRYVAEDTPAPGSGRP